MTYTITTTIAAPFDAVVEAVTIELEEEGFGILCDIDVQETLRDKLDVEVDRYRILGACNPPLAHEGLGKEPELGTLLPCNVIVYASGDGDVTVSAVDPDRLVGVAGNDALADIAADVRLRFERVIGSIDETFATTQDA